MWLRILILLSLSSCKIIDKRFWDPDYYEKKCLFHSYEEGQDKGCNYRLVPVDGSAPKPSATK